MVQTRKNRSNPMIMAMMSERVNLDIQVGDQVLFKNPIHLGNTKIVAEGGKVIGKFDWYPTTRKKGYVVQYFLGHLGARTATFTEDSLILDIASRRAERIAKIQKDYE